MSDRPQTWIVEADPHAARVWTTDDTLGPWTPMRELERDDERARRSAERGSWSQVFARQLATWIEARKGQFRKLVLTGRPRFLNLVRARLDPQLRAQVQVVPPRRSRPIDLRRAAPAPPADRRAA